MLLQMWMPRSLAMQVFTTSYPLALLISATLQPKKLFRRCPRCRGLFVLGEEYSTITFRLGRRPAAQIRLVIAFTQEGQPAAVCDREVQKAFDHVITDEQIGPSRTSACPSSLPNTSGDRRSGLTKENNTTV